MTYAIYLGVFLSAVCVGYLAALWFRSGHGTPSWYPKPESGYDPVDEPPQEDEDMELTRRQLITTTCLHVATIPVVLSLTGETAAFLCSDCNEQIDTGWAKRGEQATKEWADAHCNHIGSPITDTIIDGRTARQCKNCKLYYPLGVHHPDCQDGWCQPLRDDASTYSDYQKGRT